MMFAPEPTTRSDQLRNLFLRFIEGTMRGALELVRENFAKSHPVVDSVTNILRYELFMYE